MSSEESSVYSESDPDSEPESKETTVDTMGILFFRKTPNDEFRLAKNSVIYKKNAIEKGLTKDKRVTVQQVLDKRTYVRLKRLHGRGIFDFIYGVISTGKEANVYEAEGTLLATKHRIAIKVYKTSILVFKDRSRYIEGEFRFRRSYVGTKNPRKMVSQWAEKEFRNLRRISLSGVYCPAPIALKDHILVMELIQDSDGSVSRKLKDLGALPAHQWASIYSQVISIMRVLYQESKLIHADFSAYNLLYSNSRVIVIDVSQAVEHDHPNALYFLKRDCENITTFFSSVNVQNFHDEADLTGFHNGFNGTTDVDVSMATGFNLLTSFQLFNFITMDMDTDHLPQDVATNEDVEGYVNKMVFTSKNADFEHLRVTILRKRAFYRAFCAHVKSLLDSLDPVLFIFEEYGHTNFISNEATWNSMKLVNLGTLTVDVLDRLERENNLPEVLPDQQAQSHKGMGDYFDESENEFDSNDDPDEVDGPDDIDPLSMGNGVGKAQPKFTGKIPDGISAKDWKKMVKEMNRQRREHKIPKHIKKALKHKH